MYNVITVGDILIDTHVMIEDASVECDINQENCHLCLDYASKIPINNSFQSLGGNAANVACGITKLGLTSSVLSTIGDDANGKLTVSELKKFGVDTSLISKDAKALTRYAIVLNFQGERTILSYHKKRNYSWPKTIPAADWIYYTSLSDGFEKLQNSLLSYLAKHPTTRLAVNPGSFQLKNSPGKMIEIISKADLLVLNLEEAERILNTTLEREKSISAILHQLMMLGAKEAALTDAANGAWAGDKEGVYKMESYPVQIVTKTGAGDAFSSGYMAARVASHDIPHALQWGIANSCGVIQKVGAQTGLLDKAGIKKMMNKYPNIKPRLE